MNKTNDLLKVTALESGILQISLNRPDQLNALNHTVLTQLSSLLTAVQHDASVRAILMTGEGKAFCAGADIKQLVDLNGQTGITFARFGQSVFNQLEGLGKPSIAAIHGVAFGGGCELAMAATLRLASTKAFFSQPEIKLGLIPGFGGTQRLARLVGKGRALELCLTGRRFTADEAFKWGLVNEVISEENLLSRAKAILLELTKLPAFALQSIITSINQGYDLTPHEAFELEAAQFALCCTIADKNEGVKAFLEKREAVFSH